METTDADVETIKAILTYVMEQCAGRPEEELEELLERLQSGQPVVLHG
jgi:hypothetical protein